MEKRSILLITADSLRWDSISDMPHLENFADKQTGELELWDISYDNPDIVKEFKKKLDIR